MLLSLMYATSTVVSMFESGYTSLCYFRSNFPFDPSYKNFPRMKSVSKSLHTSSQSTKGLSRQMGQDFYEALGD